MSTELLTRRMDLIHTSTSAINTLKMDTSYPVKLSGIVIKVFQATSDYSNIDPSTEKEFDDTTNLFFVQNQEGSPVVTIQKRNVFDFTGNKLKNKEYINGDYVLAIIDINNEKIFIHSVQGVGREDSIYTKDMNYHCNGVNDNVILGGITNILIDLYDYSKDINYDQDEFTYDITNGDRQSIFPNDKFTIDIIGKFGIDYSATDFKMGRFNRQNRSSIMKISGSNPDRTTNISKEDDKDLELILDWKRCTVPKIRYNSNEIYAAMFNAKLSEKVNDEPVYYDYWTGENTAHFVNGNGKPYGNLFPRRLVFLSIEGCLPINVTCNNLSLETFGVGIYCETESKKCISLNNCKISILDNCNFTSIGNFNILPTGDIKTNSDFYTKGGAVYLGSAVDINAFNPTVKINNCKIKNSNGNRDSNLIINSCSTMTINNSTVEDFYNMTDGYKYGFTTVCMDYEYYPGVKFSEYESVIDNINNPSSLGYGYDLTNPNTLDMFIYAAMFRMNDDIYGGEHSSVPTKSFLTTTNDNIDNTTDFSDLIGSEFCSLNGDTFTCLRNKIELCYTPNAGYTFGAIKNIPVLWKDNLHQTDINGSKNTMGLKTKTNDINSDIIPNINSNPIPNRVTSRDIGNSIIRNEYYYSPTNETSFLPKLFIDTCKILCVGILYQLNSSTYISNSVLRSTLFDSIYNCNPINIISGELTINNCDCLYDTNTFKCYTVDRGSNSMNNMAFIKLYNPLTAGTSLVLYSTINVPSLDNYIMNNPVSIPLNSPKLNITSSNITLIPSRAFNFIPTINNDDYISLVPGYGAPGIYYNYDEPKSLSFIYCDNYVDADRKKCTNNLFNPLINPYINISDSEFKVADNASTSESFSMGNSRENSDPLYINNTYGVIIKKGSNIYSNSGSIVGNMSNYLTTMPDMTSDFNYDNYSQYLNVTKEVKSDGVSFYSNSDVLYTVYIHDINTGKRHAFDKKNDGSFAWFVDNRTYDISKCTDIISKIITMDIDKRYDFWYTLARLNNDTECTFDSTTHQVLYTKSDGTVVNMKDENPDDHIFICKIYGSDLAHSGYYIHKNFTNTDDYTQFNNFGVVGFKLKNCNFNMSNCKIGGSNHTDMRNSYGMELFTRRSPRICFDFEDAGIYKISNTTANAWATVLWSKLDKDALSKRVGSVDYTSIDLNNNGMCILQNCNLMNYNALRFKQVSEDWMDIANYPVTDRDVDLNILDKGDLSRDHIDSVTSNRNISVNNQVYRSIESDVGETLLTDPFNESVRNANEMPIMFIMNTNDNIVKIINSDIKGNETVIISGDVHFENTKYLNNNNAMMCYVNPNASLKLNNCKINLVKDVIYDRYIDHERLRDINTCISYEEVCDNKGMSKYNNNVIGIYLNNSSSLSLNNNEIIFKCNDYRSMYGISDDSNISLIHVNDSSEKTNNVINIESFKNNKIVTIFDCPLIDKVSDYDGDYNNRKIPDSKNMSIISIYNKYTNNKDSETVYSKCNPLNIDGNEFNIITLVNENDEYFIPVSKIINNENKDLAVFRPLKKNRLCAKYNYIHVDSDTEIEPNIIGNGTIIALEDQNKTRDMSIEDIYSQTYPDSILRSIHSFDDYTNSYEGKKYFNQDIKSEAIDGIISNISTGDDTYKLQVMLYLDNNPLTPGTFGSATPVVYTGFNTPIVFSNIYIPINMKNNVFINSTTEYDKTLYNLYDNNKVSIIRSATIVDINQPNITKDLLCNNEFNRVDSKLILSNNEFTNPISKNMVLNMLDFISGQEYITYSNEFYEFIKVKSANTAPNYSFNNTMGQNGIYSDIVKCPHVFNNHYNAITDTKGYCIKINNDTELTHDLFFNPVNTYLYLRDNITTVYDTTLVEYNPLNDRYFYPNKSFILSDLDVSVWGARLTISNYIKLENKEDSESYYIKNTDLKSIEYYPGMAESECFKITVNRQNLQNTFYDYDSVNDTFVSKNNVPTGTYYFYSYDFKRFIISDDNTQIMFPIVPSVKSRDIYTYISIATILTASVSGNLSYTLPDNVSNILLGPLYRKNLEDDNEYVIDSNFITNNNRLFKMVRDDRTPPDKLILNEYISVYNINGDIIRIPKSNSIIIKNNTNSYTGGLSTNIIPINELQVDDIFTAFKISIYSNSSLSTLYTTYTGKLRVRGIYSDYITVSKVTGVSISDGGDLKDGTYYIIKSDYIKYSYNLTKKIFKGSLYNTHLLDSIHMSLLPSDVAISTIDDRDYSDNYPIHLRPEDTKFDNINDSISYALNNSNINYKVDTINNNFINSNLLQIESDIHNTKSVLNKYIKSNIDKSDRN